MAADEDEQKDIISLLKEIKQDQKASLTRLESAESVQTQIIARQQAVEDEVQKLRKDLELKYSHYAASNSTLLASALYVQPRYWR
jgi:DNA/RNA endonuclease G (NUC1)